MDYLQHLSLRNPVHFIALGFGSGLASKAPGTWGSLVGLLFGALLMHFLPMAAFVLFILCGFVGGIYVCQKTADDMGVHDHGAIVWDEFIGIFLVLLALPNLNWSWLLAAFVIFRFFDILKPYPIRYFDQKLENGFGIMFDDVLAAFYSIVLIIVLRSFL